MTIHRDRTGGGYFRRRRKTNRVVEVGPSLDKTPRETEVATGVVYKSRGEAGVKKGNGCDRGHLEDARTVVTGLWRGWVEAGR